MDSIMHHTDQTLTLVATASFVISFIAGVWCARFGKRAVLPAIVVGALVTVVRAYSPPLSFAAIAAVSVLHVSAGVLTALMIKGFVPKSS